MADVVTHLCTALLPLGIVGLWPGAVHRAPRAVAFAVGAALPDLAARVPALAVERARRLGAPFPPLLDHVFDVAHMPVGVVCVAILAGLAVHPIQRRSATRWLVAGGLLHLAVDVLQDHHGHGYYLLFPLGLGRYEAACIGSEATVPWAPWLALLTAAVWALVFWRRSVAR